ncbi:hypothetical protein H5410_037041 [Solanum commersonii]|uniref:Uncharacterized protein n=1 Tax=Solanum commersonii TaxID=4109 RepID=A0A9J5Y606_SOLCO|nr:hypothetical protein H5410_037041 [Solanum commersonii]
MICSLDEKFQKLSLLVKFCNLLCGGKVIVYVCELWQEKQKESMAEFLVTLLVELLLIEKLWAKGLCARFQRFVSKCGTWAVGKGEVKHIYNCIQHTSKYISAFMDVYVEIPTLKY